MTRFVALTLFSLWAGGEAAKRPAQLRQDAGECADADNQMTFTQGKITEIGNFVEADVVSAELITIEYFSNYKVLTEKMSKELYILTQCGTTKPSQTDLADVLSRPQNVNYTVKHFTIPLQVASSSSTPHLSFFETLGLDDRIKYISPYASGSCWQKGLGCGAGLNDTAVPSQMSEVDAHFMDCGFTCDNVNGEAKGIHISATQDPAPLHSAEHIKFIAAFFNKEEAASQSFSNTLSAYAQAAVVVSPKPVVAWIRLYSYLCGGCSWETLPQFELQQPHFKLKMVVDAGGANVNGTAVKARFGSDMSLTQASTGDTYYVKVSSFNVSSCRTYICQVEQASAAFFAALGSIDVIIDTTYAPVPSTYTFDTFMTTMSLANTSNLKFMTNKKVLKNDGTISETNGNDWYESRVAHPEWAVEGLARQMHNDMSLPYKYFRNIATGEDPVVLLASSCTDEPAACLASAYPAIINGLWTNTKVQGSVTMSATGLTKEQIEVAAKTALAEHFGVDEDGLTITATETRRLQKENSRWPNHKEQNWRGGRRMAGTWTIEYVFFASAAEVAAVNTKVTAATNDPAVFKTALVEQFKVALKAAGVSDTVADAITVTGATATVPMSTATTGTTGTTATTGGMDVTAAASKTVAFISFVTVIKTLFSSM